jgi:diaminopimelate decarboxylase
MSKHDFPLELAERLVAEHGTPLFVYNGDNILERRNYLYQVIKWSKLRILYAMKANYNFHILKLLQQQDAHLETVSIAEVLLALRAGFSPDRILYTGNNVSDSELRAVVDTRVLVNLGSLSELERFGRMFPRSRICLRFNPDVVAGEFPGIQTGGMLTKFGILLQDVDVVKRLCEQHQLTVVGLHEHTGSGIQQAEQVFTGMRNLLAIASKVSRYTTSRFSLLFFAFFG